MFFFYFFSILNPCLSVIFNPQDWTIAIVKLVHKGSSNTDPN